MADVAPELLSSIQTSFDRSLSKDKTASSLLKKIDNGNATYADVDEYAGCVSNALRKAYSRNLSDDALPDGKMYWNIAERVIEPTLENNYNLVTNAATEVQQAINSAAGIGLKAQAAPMDKSMVTGIENALCAADKYSDKAYILDNGTDVFTRQCVENTMKANADFQGKSGREPKIERIIGAGCCEWCQGLAGTYSYPPPDDVYVRHADCNCIVEMHPNDGSRKSQNVHTKEWQDEEERAKIEERKKYGLNEVNGNSISRKIYSMLTCEAANYPPKKIDTNNLSVNIDHIRLKHDVTEREAISYVENAKFSLTKWNGRFENYYGDEGAAFVNVEKNEITTAFKASEYFNNVKEVMEVMENER